MGEKDIASHSALAASDLSSSQWFAVKLDSNAKWALAGVGDDAIAILQEKTASGFVGKGTVLGHSLAKYGGTVAAGDPLTVNSAGKLITATAGDRVVARAMEGGSADNVKTVLLTGGQGQAGPGRIVAQFTFDLADISAASIVTNFLPGFSGTLKKLSATVLKAATTGGKGATVTPRVNAATPTGGVLTLTSANMTPIGAVVDSTAITAGGVFGSTDTLSLVGSAVTAFAEGRAVLSIHAT